MPRTTQFIDDRYPDKTLRQSRSLSGPGSEELIKRLLLRDRRKLLTEYGGYD